MEIRIQTLTAKQLEAFINSAQFDAMPVVPVSKLRAVSQVHNPACEPGDTIMILAWAGDAMAGYLGIIPDTFSNNTRAGWLSCIWADKTYRQYGISQKMIRAALECWQYNIIGSAYVPQIKSMYERAGFLTDYKALEGRKFYFRSTLAPVLSERSEKYKRFTTLLKLMDTAYNSMFRPAAAFVKSLARKTVPGHFTLLNSETDLDTLISTCREKNPETGTRLTKDFLWMLDYPWISESKADAEPRYFFSTYIPQSGFLPYVSFNNKGEAEAFVLMLYRNGHLKVQYAYLSKGMEKQAVALIDRAIREKSIHTLTILNRAFANTYRQYSSIFFISKYTRRPFIISKQLHETLPLFSFQPGDGDCAFT